jgi:hypothetical protein
MLRLSLVLVGLVAVPALLAGCSSGPKADAAAQQACQGLAQLTRQIRSNNGSTDVRATVRRIVQVAETSKTDGIADDARALQSAAGQGASAIRSAADQLIKDCSAAGVKRPGS